VRKELAAAIFKIANGQVDQRGLRRTGGAYAHSIVVLAIPFCFSVFLLRFWTSAVHSPLDIRAERQ